MGNHITHMTFEHSSTYTSIIQHNEIIAIAILLGGYNEFGREIPVEKYQEIQTRFNDCIYEVKEML